MDEMSMSGLDLGTLLYIKRMHLLLTQDQASKKIGISRARYIQIERNKVYKLHPRTIKSIAKFMDVSTDFVLEHLPEKN